MVLAEINTEIRKVKKVLDNGTLLETSTNLERDYATKLGYLKGLRYLQQKLFIKEQEDKDEIA